MRESNNVTTRDGRTPAAIRVQNRSGVLRLLFREPGRISRRELAQRTGLDASTITHIVSELIVGGLVRESGVAESNGESRRGRREIILELVPTAAYAIGVHLGVHSVRIAACNLRGQIITRRSALLSPETPPDRVIENVARLIDGILTETAIDHARIAGVGVGAVAFLDPEAGIIQSAPSLGWGEIPIVELLQQRLDCPIVLEHHVRAMALAEQWLGHARTIPNFAVVNVDSSIGIGIVVDGALVRGENWRAGQIAHMIVRDDGPVCTCGRRGCLVTLASDRGLARQASIAAGQSPDSTLADAMAVRPNVPAEYIVFELARRGHPLALALVEETANYVALAITHLASLLDPQLIVLAATTPEHAEALLEPIGRYVSAHAPLQPTQTPLLVTSALGRDVAVLGAASLVLEHFIASPS